MSRFNSTVPVIGDSTDGVPVIFLHPQWSYDLKNIAEYSPDALTDYAIMAVAATWRSYSDKPGKLRSWTDFPINYWRRKLHVSYERISGSLNRLAEWGIILRKEGVQRGSVNRICYPKRGEEESEYALTHFLRLVDAARKEAVEQAIEEVQVIESPKPKPIEEHKESSPLTETLDSWRAKQAERGIDVSHYATERGGLTLKGYIYVESVDNSNKPVWKNLPIQEFTKDMSKYMPCVRCGRACAKELLNSDSICVICKTEL